MKEVKLDEVHPEIRELAVAWGDAKHFSMIETMQLGMQIQYVFNKIQPQWIPINNLPEVRSGKFIGINKGLEYPSPIIVGYHSEYTPHWTDYYTEEEAFITHYTEHPKDK